MENKLVKEITSMDVDFSKWYTDLVIQVPGFGGSPTVARYLEVCYVLASETANPKG
jgi:hypothetical protein